MLESVYAGERKQEEKVGMELGDALHVRFFIEALFVVIVVVLGACKTTFCSGNPQKSHYCGPRSWPVTVKIAFSVTACDIIIVTFKYKKYPTGN